MLFRSADVQRYFPVEEARYRVGPLQRILAPLFEIGACHKRLALYTANGEIVATANYAARTRPGGVNDLSVSVDPAHSALAAYLIHSLLNEIIHIAPGRATEMRLQSWSAPVIEAARTAGFEQRLAGHRMGLILSSA